MKPDNKTPKSKEELLKTLTPEQFYVTQNCGTEPPFRNEYWDHKEPGLYVDVITGEPLFCSLDKYDSGSGWPSFTRPLSENKVVEKIDERHGMIRTEVVSSSSEAHLGHVFNDGPMEDGGFRFCINSAALKFVHKDELITSGYGEYLVLFE